MYKDITWTVRDRSMPPQKITFAIKGMSCAACSAGVEKALKNMANIKSVAVSLATHTAQVEYTDAPDEQALALAIQSVEKIGFEAELLQEEQGSLQSSLGRWEAHNQDMQDELAARKRDLVPAFVFALPLLVVSMGEMLGLPLPLMFSPQKSFATFALLQLVLCLPVMISGRRFFTQGLPALWRKSPNMDTLVALGTGAAFVFSLATTLAHLYHYGFSNPETYASTMAAHEGGLLSMLFGLGAESALPHLYYESAAMVIALVSLGKYLEIRSKMRTGEAIKALLDLAPETALRLQEPKTGLGNLGGIGNFGSLGGQSYALWQREEIPVEHVQVKDVLLVRPGGRIPVDGLVLSGESFVDESMLTGESMPVTKTEGEPLTSGTMNGQGALFMRAERVGGDTVLARIVQLVQEAQASKASIANLADKVSLYFVPIVIVVALLSGLFWFWQSASLTTGLHFMVAVLVIACPCAMGLATPMSIMVASGRGAQLGVLFKNGQALENTARLKTIVFDKTGTLTHGKPELAEIHVLTTAEQLALQEFSPNFVSSAQNRPVVFKSEVQDSVALYLQVAASLESSSEHPLAKAICEAAKAYGLNLLSVTNFVAQSGQGIEGRVNIASKATSAAAVIEAKIGTAPFIMGAGFRLGAEANLSEEERHVASLLAGFASKGATPVLLSINQAPVAIFSISDTVRGEAKATIEALHQQGIKTVMLTGDNSLTANYVARQVGITDVFAEVLPQGKESMIISLQKDGDAVGMVGDGINDAPALARADVGFAMNSGIDVAVQTGDVVLMSQGIASVGAALHLGKATMRNIRQNLFWAFGYNIIGLPFAAGVFFYFGGPALSPMLAGAAMALSSVSVVSNALRLRFV